MRKDKFGQLLDFLVIGLVVAEAKHSFPNKWATAYQRINFWLYEGGNVYNIDSSPDSVDKMALDYISHVYDNTEKPYWLKVLEEK